MGTANTAADGIAAIEAQKPDLVFLDIEMPHMTGIELLEQLGERSFEVIFITAYNDFAVKAFKLNAIDYLLKPVSIPELIKAVNKVRDRKGNDRETDDKNKAAAGNTVGQDRFAVRNRHRICKDRRHYTR